MSDILNMVNNLKELTVLDVGVQTQAEANANSNNRASMIVNTSSTLDNMNLQSVVAVGSIPLVYSGNGIANPIVSTIALQNHDGSTGLVTPVSSWVNETTTPSKYDAWDGIGTIKPSYALDDSATGNQKVYENITGVNTDVSPLLDTTNWKESANDIGCELWFKNRLATASHARMNTATGIGWSVTTDLDVNTRDVDDTASVSLSATNIYTIDISGTSAKFNTVGTDNYVVWIKQTTRKRAGVRVGDTLQNSTNNVGTDLLTQTNHGTLMIEHFNPSQGNTFGAFIGDTVAGLNIPHGLGKKPDVMQVKAVALTSNILTYNSVDGATKFQYFNLTTASALSITAFNDTEPTVDNFTVGSHTTGNSASLMGFYLQAESDNHKMRSVQGTGQIGNEVVLGLDMTVAGSWCMIKRTDGAYSWLMYDNTRGVGSTSNYLLADTSVIEVANSTDLVCHFTTTGIVVDGANANLNIAGGTYHIQAYSPNYNQPLGAKEITINTDTSVTLANSKNTDGAMSTLTAKTVGSQVLTIGDEFKGRSAFVQLNESSIGSLSLQPINKGLNRTDADKWGEDVVDANGTVLFKTTARHGTYEGETGFVSASSFGATGQPFLAFDKKSVNVAGSVGWLTSSGNTTGWIQYALSKDRVLKEYKIKSRADAGSFPTREPKNWTMEGSNDGITWDVLDTVINNPQPTTSNEITYISGTLANTTKYKFYKMDITANNGDVNYIGLGELELKFAISDAPYLNIRDNITRDSNDLPITKTQIAEVKVDATGIPYEVIESPINEVDLENLTVHGKARFEQGTEGINQCTAWASFDGTTTPVTIFDSYNIKDIIRTATGYFEPIFEEIMDTNTYSVVASGSGTQGVNLSSHVTTKAYEKHKFQIRTTTYLDALFNDDFVTFNVFGGKK